MTEIKAKIEADDVPTASPEDRFPVVGVGASAGGIQALTGFFKGVAEDCGVGIVIVTHLNPDRPSLLHEVLRSVSVLPVEIAKDGVRIEKNHVYVMPENVVLGLKGRALTVHPLKIPRDHKPIDAFFKSMAGEIGDCAIGVVLSGGDDDGTLGAKAIVTRGGLTFAQEPGDGPSSPQQPSMPESAIATGMINFILPVEAMGRRLAMLARGSAAPKPRPAPASTDATSVICGIVLKQTNHDFSGYKRKSFQRRVARHMKFLGLKSESDYIARLSDNPTDVDCLFRDLLISVTSFFRDPLAFEAMARDVIPGLFDQKVPGEKVRVWVPGCATGQEVYSIAILLREYAESVPDAPRIQIFGTDIDEKALQVARAGRYRSALMDTVSGDRRRRFFGEIDGAFQICRAIRDDCVFAEHSVVRDPAFSRLDLISCRNLLIYFDARYQRIVLPAFHRALRNGGFLFLGKSEFASQHSDLFEPIDRTQRIFRRTPGAGSSPNGGAHAPKLPILPIPERIAITPEIPPPSALLLELDLVSFDPAHLIVNAAGELLGASAGDAAYLDPIRPQVVRPENDGAAPKMAEVEASAGRTAEHGHPPTLSTDLNRRLGPDIASVVKQALDAGGPIRRSHVLRVAKLNRMIGIEVEPLVAPAGQEKLFLVGLTDLGGNHQQDEANLDTESRALILWRLVDVRKRLRATIAASEITMEELQSSNEELLSTNEESQSVNEEIEASKEELQALNEEMNSINAELLLKVDALDRSHADLKNLFESTQIATIFLDADCRIRTYTPAAQQLFKLIPTDEGRPLSDMAGHVAFPNLTDSILNVMKLGEPFEYQTPRSDIGAHFLIRILPYKETEKASNGVVLTFLDVTQLTDARAHIQQLGRSEAHQRVLIGELNHRVKNMLGVVIGIAELTAGTAPSPEAFYESLLGRLRAMSHAYELLSRENWIKTTIKDLVAEEMAPFDASSVTALGPDVRLGPDEALAISVVLHELATNAVKYGALSRSQGMVSINWNIAPNDDGILEIVWREVGGPNVAKAPKRGFGLNLIEREVTSQFGGAVDVQFDATGLLARISFPISRDTSGAPDPMRPAGVASAYVAGE